MLVEVYFSLKFLILAMQIQKHLKSIFNGCVFRLFQIPMRKICLTFFPAEVHQQKQASKEGFRPRRNDDEFAEEVH